LDEAPGDEERVLLAEELRGRVWEAIRCPSANHVLQKCIGVLPPQAMQFILDELVAGPDGRGGGVGQAARHRFGCRVLERLVEQGRPEWCSVLLDALVADSAELIVHPWGHYVIRHLLEHAPREWRRRLHRVVEQNVDSAATKPYARAVVSKAVAHAEDDDAASLARALCGQRGLLSGMACTRHGHEGVLRLVKDLAGPEGQEVRRQLTEEMDVFQHTRFGRAVKAALVDA
jgi:mRNA-binding protein PUF3